MKAHDTDGNIYVSTDENVVTQYDPHGNVVCIYHFFAPEEDELGSVTEETMVP